MQQSLSPQRSSSCSRVCRQVYLSPWHTSLQQGCSRTRNSRSASDASSGPQPECTRYWRSAADRKHRKCQSSSATNITTTDSCMVAISLPEYIFSPRHILHNAASRCLRSGVHSTACLSSRSRSCPPAARCSYSTRSKPGATSCHSRPALRTRPARPHASAAGSDGTTWRKKTKKGERREERETVNMAVDWRRSNTPSDVPLTGSILIGDHYLNI